VDQVHGDCAFAYGGGDALDVAGAHIADGRRRLGRLVSSMSGKRASGHFGSAEPLDGAPLDAPSGRVRRRWRRRR